MCTDEDYKQWTRFIDKIHMSQCYVLVLVCRLLSLLLESNV